MRYKAVLTPTIEPFNSTQLLWMNSSLHHIEWMITGIKRHIKTPRHDKWSCIQNIPSTDCQFHFKVLHTGNTPMI